MEIGSLIINEFGHYKGRIETADINVNISLRDVTSANPRAPDYEIVTINRGGSEVRIGALWERAMGSTGELYLSGKLEDISLDEPMSITAFLQEEGRYNIVWSRSRRRATPF